MNDPQENESLQSNDVELAQFEQQLRSLVPRAAHPGLPEVAQVSAKVPFAEKANPALPPSVLLSSTEQHHVRRSYALTLLATWSLGAAAGALITLGLQNPSAVESSNTAKGPTEAAVAPDTSLAIDTLDSSNSPIRESVIVKSEVPKQGQRVAQASPFEIALLPWTNPLNRSPETAQLSAFSHMFPLSRTDASVMQFGNPSFESATESPSTHEGQQQTPIVPVKIDVMPPASQRDMLHDLLDSYGSIY